NALFSKVYKDADLIADNNEGTDVAVKNFLKAMAKAAPSFLKSSQRTGAVEPLVDNVVAAYHLIKSAKRQKAPVKDLLKNKELKKLIPYKAVDVAEYFEGNNTRPGAIGFYLRNLANVIGSTESMLRKIQQPDLARMKEQLANLEKSNANKPKRKPGKNTGRKRS